jgi:hypothetical protein
LVATIRIPPGAVEDDVTSPTVRPADRENLEICLVSHRLAPAHQILTDRRPHAAASIDAAARNCGAERRSGVEPPR